MGMGARASRDGRARRWLGERVVASAGVNNAPSCLAMDRGGAMVSAASMLLLLLEPGQLLVHVRCTGVRSGQITTERLDSRLGRRQGL